MFLEAEGSLEKNFSWQQLQPVRGSLLEGIGRLPRQLIGSDSSVPTAVEAQQNARNTSDLLRRFRELGERMRQEYRAPPALEEQEARLRVCSQRGPAPLVAAAKAAARQSHPTRPVQPRPPPPPPTPHTQPTPALPRPCAGAARRRRGVRRQAGGSVAARRGGGQGV